MSELGEIDDRRVWTPSMMPEAILAHVKANPDQYPGVDLEELRARLERETAVARKSGKYIFPGDPDYPPAALNT